MLTTTSDSAPWQLRRARARLLLSALARSRSLALAFGGTTCLALLVQFGLICFYGITCLIRQTLFFLHGSQLLKNTRVRQVVLDKWFPLISLSLARSPSLAGCHYGPEGEAPCRNRGALLTGLPPLRARRRPHFFAGAPMAAGPCL